MKLQRIDITNFLRITRMKLDLSDTRIHLFAGHNEAGKTSLQEAIRYCILGETERVKLKRDYPMMVTDGAKSGTITLTINGEEITRDVGTGKGSADQFIPPFALDAVLDATRYSWMDEKKRRSFLFKLLGVSVKPADVRERLLDLAVPENIVDLVLPMIKAGFEAAHNTAREKTSEARGEWKGITNETYGPKKAPDWMPSIQEISAETEEAERKKLAEYELAHNNAIAAQAEHRTAAKGGVYAPCPECGVEICYDRGEFKKSEGGLKSREALQHESVEAAKLAEAVFRTSADLSGQRELIAKLDKQLEFNNRNEEVKARADEVHKQIVAWSTVADAMAPDGIPATIISERLKPVNDRLRDTASLTGWPQVSILADMTIMVEGRPYGLQSESSQWRAQAAITEAISAISELGLFVLDRIDVLDLPNRTALLKWIMKIAKDHQTILLIGTLKEKPKLPGTIAVHWLSSGKILTADPF